MAALSLKDCAKDLGVAPSTIWRFVQRGLLPALKVGRVYRVESATWMEMKARLQYAPPLQAPPTVTRVDAKLIDACKPTH